MPDPKPSHRATPITALLLLAWLLALVGYFGPWVGRRAAALAWNAYDLFDLLRRLPEIETGALRVDLHTLRLPLLGLAVLLPLVLARAPARWRLAGGAVGAGLALMNLPPYPQILTAWRTPGWRVPFWWSLGAMGCALALALAPLRRPRGDLGAFWARYGWPALQWAGAAGAALVTLAALRTFQRLRPALSALHATPIGAGWGLWACALGMAALALGLAVRSRAPTP